MPPVITIKGIDEAISSLNYRNQKSPKYLLVQAIRGRYVHEASIQSLESIDTETLIRSIWKTGHDRSVLRNRRKNLNSIRSSVNADLRRLYEADKNPEGIMIGPSNTFVMSDEAKDLALEAMRGEIGGEGGTSPAELGNILRTLKEFLTKSRSARGFAPGGDPKALNALMELIRELSGDMEMGGLKGGGDLPGSGSVDAPREPGGGISQGLGDTGSGSRGGDGSEGGPGEAPLASAAACVSSGEDLESVDDLVEIEEEIEPEGLEEVIEDRDIVEDPDGTDLEEFEIQEAVDEMEEMQDAAALEPVDEVLEGVGDQAEDLEEISEEDVPDDSEFEEVLIDDDETEDAGASELLDPGGESEEADSDVEEIEVDENDEAGDGGVLETLEAGTTEELEELEEVDDDDLIEEGGGIDLPEISIDFQEAGLLAGVEESGGLLSDQGEENLNEVPGEKGGSRHLSEQFNHSLAAMDRFYNQYILIPGGTYTIGKKRPGRDDRSEQSLELPSFYFGKFPVTNALFEVFVEKTGYRTIAEKVGYGTVYYGREKREVNEETGLQTFSWNSALTSRLVEGACWYQPLGPGSTLHNKRSHPVVQIGLEDAMAFAAWTGKRLPTEDEWEAASRTERGHPYPWGEKWREGVCNVEKTSIGDTASVDRFLDQENTLGIADTLGNVLEWTTSPFRGEAGSTSGHYIAKGGSWVSSGPLNLSDRFFLDAEWHSNILGFRCLAY